MKLLFTKQTSKVNARTYFIFYSANDYLVYADSQVVMFMINTYNKYVYIHLYHLRWIPSASGFGRVILDLLLNYKLKIHIHIVHVKVLYDFSPRR